MFSGVERKAEASIQGSKELMNECAVWVAWMPVTCVESFVELLVRPFS
jgi:hypothetical protein